MNNMVIKYWGGVYPDALRIKKITKLCNIQDLFEYLV